MIRIERVYYLNDGGNERVSFLNNGWNERVSYLNDGGDESVECVGDDLERVTIILLQQTVAHERKDRHGVVQDVLLSQSTRTHLSYSANVHVRHTSTCLSCFALRPNFR